MYISVSDANAIELDRITSTAVKVKVDAATILQNKMKPKVALPNFLLFTKINDCFFRESVQEADDGDGELCCFPGTLSFNCSCSIKGFYVRTLCLGLHFSGN